MGYLWTCGCVCFFSSIVRISLVPQGSILSCDVTFVFFSVCRRVICDVKGVAWLCSFPQLYETVYQLYAPCLVCVCFFPAYNWTVLVNSQSSHQPCFKHSRQLFSALIKPLYSTLPAHYQMTETFLSACWWRQQNCIILLKLRFPLYFQLRMT